MTREKWQHGTSGGYTNHACRCDACTEAHRIEMARQRMRRAERQHLIRPDMHGKYTTYLNWSCRCGPCVAAHSEKVKDRRRH